MVYLEEKKKKNASSQEKMPPNGNYDWGYQLDGQASVHGGHPLPPLFFSCIQNLCRFK